MKRYRIIAPLILAAGLVTTHAQAAGSQVGIELGCVSVASKDISITSGDCGVKRVETVKVVKIVEEKHYDGHPVHGKHPGKAKGHNKKYEEVIYKQKH